jgi:tetratricopeptide (TPR) repeat protein
MLSSWNKFRIKSGGQGEGQILRIRKATLLIGASLSLLLVTAAIAYISSNWLLLTMKDPLTQERDLRWHPELSRYAGDPQAFDARQAELKAEMNRHVAPSDLLAHMVALRELGDFYVRSGYYGTASQSYGEGLHIAWDNHVTQPDEVGALLDGQAYCFLAGNDYKRAIDHAAAAMDLLSRAGKQHSLDAMYPRSTLIEADSRTGRYNEALAQYKAFRADFAKGPINKHRFDLGLPCAYAADFAFRIKAYKDAEFLYQDANDTWRAAPGDDCQFNRALVQERLGLIAMETNQDEVAIDHFEKAAREFASLGVFGWESRAVALFYLANVQAKTGAVLESWQNRLEARKLWLQPEL